MNINSGILVKSVIEKNIMDVVENDLKRWGIDAATAIRMLFANIAKTRKLPFESDFIPQYNDEYDERFLAHIDEIESELSNPENIIKFKNSDSAIDYLKRKCCGVGDPL